MKIISNPFDIGDHIGVDLQCVVPENSELDMDFFPGYYTETFTTETGSSVLKVVVANLHRDLKDYGCEYDQGKDPELHQKIYEEAVKYLSEFTGGLTHALIRNGKSVCVEKVEQYYDETGNFIINITTKKGTVLTSYIV